MNAASTAPRKLDAFETALLTELTAHVASRGNARAAIPLRSEGGHRWWAAEAAAAAVVTASAVVWTGGGAVPAYAVHMEANGDVVVEINRLEDSAGLEAALADHGIEADVYFMTLPNVKLWGADGTLGPAILGPGEENRERADELCSTGDNLVQLNLEDGVWTMIIPDMSPVQDHHVQFAAGAAGQMSVLYTSDKRAADPLVEGATAPIGCWDYIYAQ